MPGGDEEHLVNGVEPDHGRGEPARHLVAHQDPVAARSCRMPRMNVIRPQVRRLPKTLCAFAVNTCELAIAAMP